MVLYRGGSPRCRVETAEAVTCPIKKILGSNIMFKTTLALSFLLAAGMASAHPGGLNAEGCHTNKKTGEYHCHRSPAADKEKGIVKKSNSGICHDPSSPYYAQTQHYTEFSSIEECLNSGGRLPK